MHAAPLSVCGTRVQDARESTTTTNRTETVGGVLTGDSLRFMGSGELSSTGPRRADATPPLLGASFFLARPPLPPAAALRFAAAAPRLISRSGDGDALICCSPRSATQASRVKCESRNLELGSASQRTGGGLGTRHD